MMYVHGSEWRMTMMNNSAAIGYMILAAKRYGLTSKQISELESLMTRAMDRHTEEEAEKEYQNT